MHIHETSIIPSPLHKVHNKRQVSAPQGSARQRKRKWWGHKMKLFWSPHSVSFHSSWNRVLSAAFSDLLRLQLPLNLLYFGTNKNGVIMLPTKLAFFLGSRNKKKISFLILIKAISSCYTINPLLTKVVHSKWLDIDWMNRMNEMMNEMINEMNENCWIDEPWLCP